MSSNIKDDLLSFLQSKKEDRGALANLRCALRKNLKYRAWPMLSFLGGIENPAKEYDHRAKVVQTIAGLFATHTKETSYGDFGQACTSLVGSEEKKKFYDTKKMGSVSKRFQYLLSSEKEEICDRVIRFVLRMKANDVPVNYSELYDGLLFWGDKIKAKWAGSFWKVNDMEDSAV